jgi:hypothetical protein
MWDRMVLDDMFEERKDLITREKLMRQDCNERVSCDFPKAMPYYSYFWIIGVAFFI